MDNKTIRRQREYQQDIYRPFIVKPFVGLIRGTPALKANPDEIGEMFFVSLEHLLDAANSVPEVYTHGGVSYQLKAYHYGSHRIWGATALILQTLFEKFLVS